DRPSSRGVTLTADAARRWRVGLAGVSAGVVGGAPARRHVRRSLRVWWRGEVAEGARGRWRQVRVARIGHRRRRAAGEPRVLALVTAPVDDRLGPGEAVRGAAPVGPGHVVGDALAKTLALVVQGGRVLAPLGL